LNGISLLKRYANALVGPLRWTIVQILSPCHRAWLEGSSAEPRGIPQDEPSRRCALRAAAVVRTPAPVP